MFRKDFRKIPGLKKIFKKCTEKSLSSINIWEKITENSEKISEPKSVKRSSFKRISELKKFLDKIREKFLSF